MPFLTGSCILQMKCVKISASAFSCSGMNGVVICKLSQNFEKFIFFFFSFFPFLFLSFFLSFFHFLFSFFLSFSFFFFL